MENEYLGLHAKKYKPLPPGEKQTKGCFARLFSKAKVNLIKNINEMTKTTHKGQIRMKRRPEEIAEGTRWKRRQKGTTLGQFYNKMESENGQVQHVLDKLKMNPVHAERHDVSFPDFWCWKTKYLEH